jgi:hypothetical protein
MVIELGGSVFEITHDLVGDLFRAKNAGVTQSQLFFGVRKRPLGPCRTERGKERRPGKGRRPQVARSRYRATRRRLTGS